MLHITCINCHLELSHSFAHQGQKHEWLLPGFWGSLHQLVIHPVQLIEQLVLPVMQTLQRA